MHCGRAGCDRTVFGSHCCVRCSRQCGASSRPPTDTLVTAQVEMHCLRNANTVRGIVCFMCPADRDDGPGTNAAPSHQAAHQAMAAMAAGSIPGVPNLAATLGYGGGLALGGIAPQASSSSSTISLTQAGLALSAMGSQNRL